jgi:hypothetical protein
MDEASSLAALTVRLFAGTSTSTNAGTGTGAHSQPSRESWRSPPSSHAAASLRSTRTDRSAWSTWNQASSSSCSGRCTASHGPRSFRRASRRCSSPPLAWTCSASRSGRPPAACRPANSRRAALHHQSRPRIVRIKRRAAPQLPRSRPRLHARSARPHRLRVLPQQRSGLFLHA